MTRVVFRGGTGTCSSPCRPGRFPNAVGALDGFPATAPKEVNEKFNRRLSQKRPTKIFVKGFPKKSLKIALGTGGALSIKRPLGKNVRPHGVVSLDDFLHTPLQMTR